MRHQDSTDPLILLTIGDDGRLASASTTRSLADLHATEADLRRYLGRRRPRRALPLDRVGTQAA